MIKEIVALKTNSKTRSKSSPKYLSASRIALGISIERLCHRIIPKSLTSKSEALSLFHEDLEAIAYARKPEQQSAMTKSLIQYIDDNHKAISEEDLGGISELISGHMVAWKGEEIKFEHNPSRRALAKFTLLSM